MRAEDKSATPVKRTERERTTERNARVARRKMCMTVAAIQPALA